jgi:hypothetical protein
MLLTNQRAVDIVKANLTGTRGKEWKLGNWVGEINHTHYSMPYTDISSFDTSKIL